ncbi:MAG: hypothetical protein CME67_03105 [Halobacteriovoraceae bacterium]|nr:hypothetical protein [Halobacteriovoraceae bacterium]|tara:strand:- start:3146 stop:4360 length:1215 start_codon:yes stop_codon:yes gene_type:complete
MKKIIIVTTLFFSVFIAAGAFVFALPYYMYNKTIKGGYKSSWYHVDDFSPIMLSPNKVDLEVPNIGNEDLWQKFQLKDTYVPLPVKNPFYYVAPILDYDENNKRTRLGLTVYGTGLREISKIFFVSNAVMNSELRSQELFKLPVVARILKNKSSEQVWKDMFSKQIGEWNIPFSEMAYNLYILQLRLKLFPNSIMSFGSLNETTGIIKLPSKNKDYITELVMTRTRGVVYSYLIMTEKNNRDSNVLRYKFLQDIEFRPGSKSLASIIYKEFKALPFKKKVDHEGMFYLMSAFSHDLENRKYLKQMIYWLERGEDNQKQLKALYEFASKKYGKVFTNRLVEGLEVDPEILLQRNIELENAREIKKIKNRKVETEVRSLSQEEIYKERVESSKKNKRISPNRMIMD